MSLCLQVRRRTLGGRNARNNPVETFGDPQDWHVWAIAPGASAEPADPNRDLSLILWTVYAPANEKVPGELDRVILNGVEYGVEGRPGDWTHGPWGPGNAGVVVELKRVEG